nr:hypothetical protein [uncultured Draconibacterium sp.]
MIQTVQITGLVLIILKESLKMLPFEINIGEWGFLRDELELSTLFEFYNSSLINF